MVVSVLGGNTITNGGTFTINAGNSLTFQITNPGSGCSALLIQSVTSSNSDFSISPSSIAFENIKTDCNNGNNKNSLKYLNFKLTANDTECGTTSGITTRVTIKSNEIDFYFDFTVVRAPIISVFGGIPSATINNGTINPPANTPSASTGTYFGIIENGGTETRRYYVFNTGSCPLAISAITSSISDFTITAPSDLPLPQIIDAGKSYYFDITFTAGLPADNEAIISISNTDATSNPFTFNVSAEVFDVTGPGPGGVTADFRLWLKATRGIRETNSKVYLWKDLGVNGKDAMQDIDANQPAYRDDAASNINFNPVIEFENTGVEQFLYNSVNGFYSQDIFIVMIPDNPVISTTARNTIFSGVNKKAINDVTFDANDITGVGFGDYTTRFSNEVLTYGQNTEAFFNGALETNTSYANAGIINVRNDAIVAKKQELLYNSKLLSTTPINDVAFTNVGYIDGGKYWGTPYWIGRNYGIQGSLNGRIAEIMTFAERVPDDDGNLDCPDNNSRQKIETYLAVKYGITLGATTAEKNYVNSAGTIIWNTAANDGFNYNIAGIGKDDSSDLNQKQSKSVNEANEVTIGLGGLYNTNSANTNEFSANLDFLVWGCNDLAYTTNGTNVVTLGWDLPSTITKIGRKWKIVETGGDVENIYIGIPEAAFIENSFTKTLDEEYVLIVSDNVNFDNEYIIDVIPLKINTDAYGAPILDKEESKVYKTWYDFDGTKYFTFGKAPKLAGKLAINITAGDYLVGETDLPLNYNSFTVSAWIRNENLSLTTRTIMAKGGKMQMRLSSANNIQVVLEDDSNATITSKMVLNDGKWHQVTFVYESGTIFLYIDGILDCSKQNIDPPTPNFNRFSVGALYLSKNEDDIKNRFFGEIDEVYIWNRVLTQDQIRYLMNQEIAKVSDDLVNAVNGRALPQAITNNEAVTIPWSDLKVFYDFNAFYGSAAECQTKDEDNGFLRITYLEKPKTIVKAQTAPLPYTTIRDGSWDDITDTKTPWRFGSTVWNIPNSLGLDGLTTIDWNIVETNHNIASDRNITVLGLKNNSGKITIKGTNAVEAIPGIGQSLRVTHYLELDGAIDLEGESQLLQDTGSILDQESGGFIEKDQQGTANSFNYNYWSSSVGPITAKGSASGIASSNAPFTIKGTINDGRSASSSPPTPPPGILSILYGTSPYAADKAPDAQLTISSYWLYQFYGKDDDYNSWFPRINEDSYLAPGVGYTMKGSSGKVPITNQQNYVFRGKPYNGDITLELKNSDGIQRDRLIGNPYPSALDANEFILDHIKKTEIINGGAGRNDVNVFNGALYFWDHFGYINSHNLGAYVGGYATYTLMGGAQAIADDARINTKSLLTSTKVPERYIPVGQGFFVITALDAKLAGKTTTTVDGGTITFKNSQRYFKREGSSGLVNTGSVFMKNSKTKKENEGINGEEEDFRPKIRLLFHSPNGYNRQLLIGADENTTNNFDIGYDGLIADTGSEDMFWMIQGAKFVIQGVPNFNTDQEFPLGIKIAKAGLATIKIDAFENIDENLSPHIKDRLTGETHNISKKPFEIDLAPGTYLDRFALTFKMQKLVTEDVLAELLIPAAAQPIIEGIHVLMNNAIGELQIKNNSTEEITSIVLYNYLGQTLKTWNSNFNIRTISLPLSTATGVYLVQINTKTGNTVKKISVE